MRGARIVVAAAGVQLRLLAVDLFLLFTSVLQTFFIAMTVMLMLRGRPDFEPIYVVVGAGLAGVWSTALFTGNWGIARERGSGTLELLVGSPAPLILVLSGKMLGSMVLSLASMVTSYVIGAYLFGYDITIRHPVEFALSFVLAAGAFWSIGVLLAPIAVLSRKANRFVSILEYPVYTLAGFVFPVLLLPSWLRPLSGVLPPYWAAVALHGTSSGDLHGVDLIGAWSVLLLSTAIAIVIARALFEIVLVRARVEGTLPLA